MSSKKKALQLIGKQDTSFITSTPLKSANFIVENVEKYTNESNVFQTVRKNAQAQPKKILEASQKFVFYLQYWVYSYLSLVQL